MAPKRGTKRPAEATLTPEAKKLKETLQNYGVAKSLYEGVVEGIQRADVPNAVRQMLIAMVPEGICVPAEQRHEYQVAHVKMVEEVLLGVQAKLREVIGSAEKEVARIEAAKVELEQEVQRADKDLEQANEGEAQSKLQLAEVTREVLANKALLAEKETARREGDAAFEAAKEEKILVEAAISEDFRLLRDGEVEEEEAKLRYGRLENLAGQIGFEASLMTALPTSILKKPGDRGSFDAMVVAQLQEGLTKQVAHLTEVIENGAQAAAERAAAVEQVNKALEAAKLKQQDAAERFENAQQVQKERQDLKKKVVKKEEQCEPELQAAKTILKDAETDLENFTNYNWGCFETLRKHSAKPKPTQDLQEAQQLEAAEAGA